MALSTRRGLHCERLGVRRAELAGRADSVEIVDISYFLLAKSAKTPLTTSSIEPVIRHSVTGR